jgi:outer membrane protein assembly factor BamB
MIRLRLMAFTVLFSTVLMRAEDWPQWRGPDRNGISKEKGLLQEWPKQGPKLLWEASNAGAGYSTPAVVRDRAYLLGNEGLENESVEAYNVKDGKRVWSTRLGKVGNPKQNPNYPAARSTPTIEGDVLYALGSDGDLACMETSSGKIRWHKNLRTDFNGKPGEWAYSESPLIDGELLICTPGGADSTLIALNKTNAAIVWQCAVPGGDTAAYASAILIDAAGAQQCVQVLQRGLVGVGAKTGEFLWRYPRLISKYNASIPTPIASGDLIYCATAGTGGGVVKIKPHHDGMEAEEVYFEAKLPAGIGGVVKLGDNVYGTTAQAMMCFDFNTGKIKWEERAIGAAAVCFADGRIYMHGENGDVALMDPSPDGYKEKGRFTPPNQPARVNPNDKAWAHPVVSNGRLFIRDHSRIWCFEVKNR